MRLSAWICVVSVAGLSMASFAQGPGGQRGPGGGMRGGGQFRMPTADMNASFLALPAVQKELKLTPAQISSITAALPQRGGGRGGPGGPGGPGGNRPPQPGGNMGDRQAEMQKALGFLNAGQKSRLKQLTLQSMGAVSLLLPAVSSSLGLNKNQTSQIEAEGKKINDERQKAFQSMGTMRPGQGGVADPATQARMNQFRAQNEKWRAEYIAVADKVLTGPQRSKWHGMMGKPFDINLLRRPRGGGGGGGRGRGA